MNRKTELLTNAAKIIYEEGIQKLTMDYLAKVSDMTKGGVLYHFDTKENLLIQMNTMAIETFETKLDEQMARLTGSGRFTRAYAYATLDFFKHPETALLPALFISSTEYKSCYQLWEKTSEKWETSFQNDDGDATNNLQLRLICDGIWFSILYTEDHPLSEQIESLILTMCHTIEKGAN